MKRKEIITLVFITSLMFILVSSCQKEPIPIAGGDDLQEQDLMSAAVPTLHCEGAEGHSVQVIMTPGEEDAVSDFYVTVPNPLEEGGTFMLEIGGEELVREYAGQQGIECMALPETFASVKDNTLEIRNGSRESRPCSITLTTVHGGEKLLPGRYLLPVKVSDGETVDVMYIDLTVRSPFQKQAELYTGQDMFTVFYVNTGQFDPRLITDFCLEYWNIGEAPLTIDIGNILNLRKSQVRWDIDESRPILNLYPDLKYVLDHNWKYILPVQESGRKVCLCVEGGGQGIGFCNLNEVQIEDLTDQIADVVERYQLDGVNLWDRGSNYGKEGMPAFDKTSYPKFIKTLRQKLGRRRLLTLVDHEKPTESFGDKVACGGIEVGKYIDYAWSGYCDNRENIQVVDPYHPDAEGVSEIHVRKSILGLTEKRYGCLNAYWRSNDMPFSIYDDLVKYEKLDIRQSGLFVFGEDIRSNMQDQYEGEATPANLIRYVARAHGIKGILQMGRRWGSDNYGKWLKDW